MTDPTVTVPQEIVEKACDAVAFDHTWPEVALEDILRAAIAAVYGDIVEAARRDRDADEVLVEGSWFRRDELPRILGNFMRAADEDQREVKRLGMMLADLRDGGAN